MKTYKARYLGEKRPTNFGYIYKGCYYTISVQSIISDNFLAKFLKISQRICVYRHTTKIVSGSYHYYNNIEDLLSEWELIKEKK